MSRILAYTSPAAGHLFPLTPILDELADRGRQITLRTLAAQGPLMQARGFAAAPKPAPACPPAGCDPTGYATKSTRPSTAPPEPNASRPLSSPPAALQGRSTRSKPAYLDSHPTSTTTSFRRSEQASVRAQRPVRGGSPWWL